MSATGFIRVGEIDRRDKIGKLYLLGERLDELELCFY